MSVGPPRLDNPAAQCSFSWLVEQQTNAASLQHRPGSSVLSEKPGADASALLLADKSVASASPGQDTQEQQQLLRQPRDVYPGAREQHYPAALTTHDAVLADCSLFVETLRSLHAALGLEITVPSFAGRALDLHKLYKEVTSRGGLEAVMKDKKWMEVILAFDIPPAISESYALQRNYIDLLHHYEQVYFFGIQGEIVSAPAALCTQNSVISQLPDIEMDIKDSCEAEDGLKKAKGIIDSAQALGVDPASSIGSTITGAIDAKFDYGYLVTVMVGTRKMKGVLYHVPSVNAVPQHVSVPALIKNVGSELKSSDLIQEVSQKRRKKETCRKDPNAPRQNRSGYNFFFAEQQAKLKTMQPDKDRAISKMIGDLWSRLSENEKIPYQEQGLRDKERYIKEMKDYKEKINLPMTCEGGMNDPRAANSPLRIDTLENGGNGPLVKEKGSC